MVRRTKWGSELEVPACREHVESTRQLAGTTARVYPLQLSPPGERQRADRPEGGGTRGSAGERALQELLERCLTAGNHLASGLIGAFGADFPGPETVGNDAAEWFHRCGSPRLALLGYETWIGWRAAILASRAIQAQRPELEDHLPPAVFSGKLSPEAQRALEEPGAIAEVPARGRLLKPADLSKIGACPRCSRFSDELAPDGLCPACVAQVEKEHPPRKGCGGKGCCSQPCGKTQGSYDTGVAVSTAVVRTESAP